MGGEFPGGPPARVSLPLEQQVPVRAVEMMLFAALVSLEVQFSALAQVERWKALQNAYWG